MVLFIGYGERVLMVEATERAKMSSAFITPIGLFEWLHMPFRLKTAPQIYQRLVDNALYKYLRIASDPSVISPNTDKIATESP